MSEETAVVTGATGQDGYFLTQRLLDEGWTVYAAVRDTAAAERLFGGHDRLRAVRRDLADPGPLAALIGDLRGRQVSFIDYTAGTEPTDTHGHGTFVAGIAVGNGATAQAEGVNSFLWGHGVAPGASYVRRTWSPTRTPRGSSRRSSKTPPPAARTS